MTGDNAVRFMIKCFLLPFIFVNLLKGFDATHRDCFEIDQWAERLVTDSRYVIYRSTLR